MIKLLKSVFLTIMIVSLTSCASIFTQTTYPVYFKSEPSHAKLSITNKKGFEIFSGETPATVMLKSSDGFFSKAEYYVKVSLPGYSDFTTLITADLEGWYFGNILLGGLIGMLIIDPATGAMWTIRTEYVNIELIPDDRTLQVISIDQVPENLKEHIVRVN